LPSPLTPPPAAKQVPQTPEAWLARMTDMTQNMSAYKDPKVFVPFMNAVTEPSFYTTMGNNMMDPGNWLNMANSMTQPGVYSNVAAFRRPERLHEVAGRLWTPTSTPRADPVV
jgi:hypothetical protein